MGSGITQWLCGGCGRVHGWVCPYFGYPGESLKWSDARRAAARKRLEKDLARAALTPTEGSGS